MLLRSSLPLLLLAFVVPASVSAATLPFRNNASSLVLELTDPLFQSQLLGGRHVWAVAFVDSKKAGGDALKFAALWEGVATKLNGLIRVGAVDKATEFGSKLIEQFQLNQLPVILSFPCPLFADPKQYAAVPFVGEPQENAIVNWAAKQLPGNLVVPMKDQKMFDELMRSTEYPKVVHVSKGSTPAYLKALTLELINRFSFAEIPPTVNIEDANLQDRPSLLVYISDSEPPKRFEGQFSYSSVLEFLLPLGRTDDEVREFVEMKKAEMESRKDAKQKPKKQKAEPKPAAVVQRVHTAQGFTELFNRNGITFIAFLDPQAENHKSYLQTLYAVLHRTQRKGTRFHIVWVDGNQQHLIGEAFGISQGELPAGVFINPKKDWYRQLIGAFTEQGIWKFSQGPLLQGTGKALGKLPEFAEESNPDGLFEFTEQQLAEEANKAAPEGQKEDKIKTQEDSSKKKQSAKQEKEKKPEDPEAAARAEKRKEAVKQKNLEREERMQRQREEREKARNAEKARREAARQQERERNEKRKKRREEREEKEREAQKKMKRKERRKRATSDEL
eukprot:TRINITY_DN99260_c0_g1_i1.p1 TRINITY_DN99260_c0_g1~~TRINITY_DN99260_c0_g1_i1.p1  ORF type:complete len:560 (+),score=131.33 TRINITY_DN99260_c0_g1_i1:21-1700(+)